MITSLKRSSYSLSKRLGLSDLVAQSAWRRQRLLILCYHGVSLADEHEWRGDLYVSPDHLARHLELLRRADATVLPLGEGLQRLYAQDLPERAVVLTFDDGYYDFSARAWPLLQRCGFPATVYLTTARVRHNLPVVNLFVSYMFWAARSREFDARGIVGLDGRHPLATAADRDRVSGHVDRATRPMTAGEKDEVARQIAERLELDYHGLLASRMLTLMRPEEVTELSRQGLDVQLHTHMHRTPEDAGVFVQDVLRNRDLIEQLTGRRPAHLCYPSGVYRAAYLPGLRREGLLSATTCDPGMAGPLAEPLLLPRFIDSTATSDLEFDAWVSGVASCLPRRTTKAHPAIH